MRLSGSRSIASIVEQIELDFDRDRWFRAEEAKAYGIIDHVISPAAQVAA